MSRVWDFLGASPADEELHQASGRRDGPKPGCRLAAAESQEIAQALQKGKHGTWREMFTARDRQIFQPDRRSQPCSPGAMRPRA